VDIGEEGAGGVEHLATGADLGKNATVGRRLGHLDRLVGDANRGLLHNQNASK
jgi:hypothetical protein